MICANKVANETKIILFTTKIVFYDNRDNIALESMPLERLAIEERKQRKKNAKRKQQIGTKISCTTKIADYYKQLSKIILKRGKYGVVWCCVE